MRIKPIDIDRIRKDFKRIQVTSYNKYFDSYFEFIDFFEGKDKIKKEDLIISTHFVYGWMPTMLKIDLKLLDDAVCYINKVKNGTMLDYDDFDNLKKFVNNSVVGSSKLLHFVNPNIYAIWDSRVYRYFTDYKSQSRIGDISLYFNYLDRIKKLVQNNEYDEIHELIYKNVGKEMSKLRSIELIMFRTDELNSKK